jgi:radical SAM-linked protein
VPHDPAPPSVPATAPPPAVQRWRLTVSRAKVGPDLAGRELTAAWLSGLAEQRVPVAWTGGATPRPRIAFGAALPAGTEAHGELVDIALLERWPIWRMRTAITAALPAGWQLVDLADVWVGAPALPASVAAADHAIAIRRAPAGPDRGMADDDTTAGLDPRAVEDACTALLEATALSRTRPKGGSIVTYDLRPLLVGVHLARPGPPLTISVRTRIHPELGTGRPEEVVGALGDALGIPLEITDIVRERLILAEDIDPPRS